MDGNQSLNTQDILDSIDMNMINMTDKKKRGRPKKNNNIINTNLTKIKLDNPLNNNEQEEIILHLPLTKNDILNFKEGEINILDIEDGAEESSISNEHNEISNKHLIFIKKLIFTCFISINKFSFNSNKYVVILK